MVGEYRVDELEEFYNQNRKDLTFEGADRNPDTAIEYNNEVKDFLEELSNSVQQKIRENYSTETAKQYAEKAGEMLAERVGEELKNPYGRPGDGGDSPNFDTARRLLGE